MKYFVYIQITKLKQNNKKQITGWRWGAKLNKENNFSPIKGFNMFEMGYKVPKLECIQILDIF